MLGQLRIASFAAAALVASPAFAGWPLTQAVQIEPIGGERVITEAVVNSHLTDTNADAAPASELRPLPDWLDESSDPRASTNVVKRT